MSDSAEFRIIRPDTGAVVERVEPGRATQNRPTKALPSPRLRFESQLKVLRGWAIAGRENPTPSNDDVADVCGIAGTTISGNNAFLVEAGLLVKEGGGYRPSPETLDYGRAVEWNASDAEQKLAPAVVQSWFWQALAPRLRFSPVSRDDAVRRLAEQANAGTEHRNQLGVILEWLEAVRLIRIDGDQISLVQLETQPQPPLKASRPDEGGREGASPDVQTASTPPLPGIDPVILAWVHRMPPTDKPWPRAKKEQWFIALRALADGIWQEGDEE